MLLGIAPSAEASLHGQDGVLSGVQLDTLKLATVQADGSGPKSLNVAGAEPSWAPDGSRVAYVNINTGASLHTVDANGGNPAGIGIPAGYQNVRHPSFSPDGRLVFFEASGAGKATQLFYSASDGSTNATPVFKTSTGACDTDASLNSGWDIVFQRRAYTNGSCTGTPSVWIEDGATGEVRKLADNAAAPESSPYGDAVVFVRPVDGVNQLFLTDPAGQEPTKQLTTKAEGANQPAFSAVGNDIAFVRGNDTWLLQEFGTTEKLVRKGLIQPAWQPVNRDVVTRVYGNTAVETAVANSRVKYGRSTDTVGRKAKVAVLTSADYYYDGLGGSALAGAKGGPLLLTYSNGLAPEVSEELKRTLAPGSKVYVLGGTSVMSTVIDDQVRALGFSPYRLSGALAPDTGIRIAQEITATPKNVFLVTNTSHYDGLAAGAAAAAAPDSVVVFTGDGWMSESTQWYLNNINPNYTRVITVGHQADAALNNTYLNWPDGATYYPVAGNTAVDTAADLARFWYVAPSSVSVASTLGWQDALTGGAMIAGDGPVLLTWESSLDPTVASYLKDRSASIGSAYAVGGSYVLHNNVPPAIASAIALPGQTDLIDFPGQFVTGNQSRSLTAPQAPAGQTPKSLTGAANGPQPNSGINPVPLHR
jgi:putative cell wall-binding protein